MLKKLNYIIICIILKPFISLNHQSLKRPGPFKSNYIVDRIEWSNFKGIRITFSDYHIHKVCAFSNAFFQTSIS